MAKVAPNPAQLAARLVARFGHPDDMAAALAEDVTWWESPSAPAEIMASVSTGRDTVRGNMQRVFSLIYNGSTVNTTVHHAISQENMAAVRFTMAAEFPNGAPYENEYTVWVEIRDGEIVKVWEYVDAAWTLAQMQSAGMELPSLD
jgi:ketosteroid isomerase-like protein